MKTLVFPDQSKFESSILDVAEEQSLVAYKDEEAGTQVLWVPNDFISNE